MFGNKENPAPSDSKLDKESTNDQQSTEKARAEILAVQKAKLDEEKRVAQLISKMEAYQGAIALNAELLKIERVAIPDNAELQQRVENDKKQIAQEVLENQTLIERQIRDQNEPRNLVKLKSPSTVFICPIRRYYRPLIDKIDRTATPRLIFGMWPNGDQKWGSVLEQNLFPFVDDPKDLLVTAAAVVRCTKKPNTLSVFFQQILDARSDRLLQLVAYSKRSQVEALLKQNPLLLLNKGQVTDYSDRTFKNISPLHLAFWYKDTYMWKILRKHLDLNFPGEFEKQLKEFHKMERENHGFEYTHHNQIKHSMHYDIKDFTTVLNGVMKGSPERSDETIRAWESIGKATMNVPVHLAYEYCNPNDPVWASSKSFTHDEKRELPEVCSITIDPGERDRGLPYNTAISISWFPINPDLGKKFVFLPNKDYGLWTIKSWYSIHNYGPWYNSSPTKKFVSTIEALWNARTKEIENLKEEFRLEKTFISGTKEWCSIM